MQVDMNRYVRRIAISELGLKPKPDFERWVQDRWHCFGPKLGGRDLANETIEELMSGRYLGKTTIFRVLHHILTLHEYGLTPEETWKRPEDDGLLHTEGGFRALLREARSKHKDPLKLINAFSSPRLSFEVGGAQPSVKLAFAGAEPYLSSDERPVVPASSPICLSVVPQVEGCLWVFSRQAEEKTSILNEHLDCPRQTIFPAYKSVSFPVRKSASVPGDRELVVINWPMVIDPGTYDLSEMLERSDLLVSDSELRRIGLAVADSAKDADEAKRVWASVLPIRIA